jgi:hypothetical protein
VILYRPWILVIKPRDGPKRIHRFHRYSKNASIVACLIFAAETCLQTRCLAMNVCTYSTVPAFKRHVTLIYYIALHTFLSYILGLVILPLVVLLSSPWSVPFLACMSRCIMSGRTMPFSSRVDIVLSIKERKKLATELDMIFMCRNWYHETENGYCFCHNYISNKLNDWLTE